MFQIDGINSMDNMREFQQSQVSVSCDSNMRNVSPFKISVSGHTSFSASYSVSSILDMPTCKVKTEPGNKNSAAISQPSNLSNITDQKTTLDQPLTSHSTFVCLASVGSSDASDSKETNNMPQKIDAISQSNSNYNIVKQEELSGKFNTKSVIVIEDTDESSDDEPLARLVKCKSFDHLESQCQDAHVADSQIKSGAISEVKQSSPNIPTQHLVLKTNEMNKVGDTTQTPDLSSSSHTLASDSVYNDLNMQDVALKTKCEKSSKENPTTPQISSLDDVDKSQVDKETKLSSPRKTSFGSSPKPKKHANKIHTSSEGHLTSHGVNSNHGWSWIGEGQMKPIPKVSLGREEPVRVRKCYKSMQHTSGETVSIRDCVILHSDGDGKIPYVAKVSALWENLNGEMMFSMLWYYQPEHTAAGREHEDGEQELFASKHREENSVACIDDKCFVLMYNEYCRLEAEGVRLEQGVALPRWRELMSDVTADDKELCRLPPPANVCADNIWFCRYDYDIRKKVVKKPKHKKSNLRYRAPYPMI